MDAYEISASALTAQRFRMDVIASNLANVNSTRRADGQLGPYRRKNVQFSEMMPAGTGSSGPDANQLNAITGNSSGQSTGSQYSDGSAPLQGGIKYQEVEASGVKINGIREDLDTPLRRVYDPSHPDADPDGYVSLPNINPVTELVDMISASRAYEASVTALQSTKSMDKSAMEI